MPWQLIYTSAPRGLASGQSGFCTVARSADLREALAQQLERLSSYHYLRVAEAAIPGRNPIVSAFRLLDFRGTKYYVLTRIQPCGLDFTARTNHLAHHLIFQASELSRLPSPAAILRHWAGWLTSWQGEPRELADPPLEDFASAARFFLPANHWLRLTGDAGRAAGLLESECVRGCYLLCPPDSEEQVLDLFCESLQLLDLAGQHALRPWRHTFTSFLQAEDNPSDFQWRTCQEGTPGYQLAAKHSAAFLPLRSVRVPPNSLAKVAREGQKAPTSTSLQSVSSIRSALELKGQPAPPSKPAPWLEPVASQSYEEPDDKSNRSGSAQWKRFGVFAVVLAAVLAIKFALPQKHTFAPIPVPSVAPAEPPAKPAAPSPAATPDPSQLETLSADGPTFVAVTADFSTFTIPISSNLRLQKLINRFDSLATLPNQIQASLNTDRIDSPSGAPLTIEGRQGQMLSARTVTAIELTFDYSNWKNDGKNPLVVHTVFSAPLKSFSIQFSFASAADGDPFRLLVLNENGGPAPLRFSLPWLESENGTLPASLHERLYGSFFLPSDWRWQLQPFIKLRNGQTRYLYKDWPDGQMPPPENELNFAAAKAKLSGQVKPMKEKTAEIAERLNASVKKADLDLPLGKDLGLPNPKLISFASFAPDPTQDEFVSYLNALKRQAKLKKWPRLDEDDDDAVLADKFQQLQNFCVEKFPEERARLTAGGSNYFAMAWQNLKGIEKIRQEKLRAQDDVDKLQGRLSLIPDTLDKAAYVGLFMVNPPKPGLEIIRFEGP